MDSLVLSLIISATGMGLVFGAILLLWGLMAILVKVAQDPMSGEMSEAEGIEISNYQAAIAAVGVALSQQSSTEPREFPLPPTAVVSPWQAIMRGRVLDKRGPNR